MTDMRHIQIRKPKEFNFTAKGCKLTVLLKNGKKATGIVLRCSGSLAEVKINNKTILINSHCKEM